jgi:hypothetical protein
MELKTGRLMAMAAGLALPTELFERVPVELERQAESKLLMAAMNGKSEAFVNMRSQHPLAKWGRNRLKEKRKAKIAAKSRRRNRK